MGALDQIARQMLGSQAGQGQGQGQEPDLSGLLQGVMNMLGDNQSGGLQNVVQAFQRAGLGDVIASWISTGQNLPISPSQLEQALGNDRIGQLSAQSGLSGQQALGALAQLLPVIIDRLTPQGQAPAQSQLAQSVTELLRSLASPEGPTGTSRA